MFVNVDINKPRKTFPTANFSHNVSNASLPDSGNFWHSSLNAHDSSCHAVDGKQMRCIVTEYLSILNPTPLSLQKCHVNALSFKFCLCKCLMAVCDICSGGYCHRGWLVHASFTLQELFNIS